MKCLHKLQLQLHFIFKILFKPDHHFLKLVLGQIQHGLNRAGEEKGEDVEEGGCVFLARAGREGGEPDKL